MISNLLLNLAGILVLGLGNAGTVYAAPPSSGCALLTPAQIAKVLGKPFAVLDDVPLAQPFGDKPGSHCSYRSQTGGDHPTRVDFFVYITASPAQAKQWYDMGAAAAKPKSKLAIGDAAYLDHGEVHVLKGKVLYWIVVAPATNEKQLEDLAASVAAQI